MNTLRPAFVLIVLALPAACSSNDLPRTAPSVGMQGAPNAPVALPLNTTANPGIPDWFAPYDGQTRQTGVSIGSMCIHWEGPEHCYMVLQVHFNWIDGKPMVEASIVAGTRPYSQIPHYAGGWRTTVLAPVVQEVDGGVSFVFDQSRSFKHVRLTDGERGVQGTYVYVAPNWRWIYNAWELGT